MRPSALPRAAAGILARVALLLAAVALALVWLAWHGLPAGDAGPRAAVEADSEAGRLAARLVADLQRLESRLDGRLGPLVDAAERDAVAADLERLREDLDRLLANLPHDLARSGAGEELARVRAAWLRRPDGAEEVVERGLGALGRLLEEIEARRESE